MKISKFKLILLIFLFSINCCKPKKNQLDYENLLRTCQKNKLTDISGNRLYLVTGLDGCNACFEHTVKFIENNIENHKMIFIISGRSKVKLKTTFRPNTINSPNFVIDTALNAMRYKLLDNGFPKVYLCRDEHIVESFEVNFVTAVARFSHAYKFMNQAPR